MASRARGLRALGLVLAGVAVLIGAAVLFAGPIARPFVESALAEALGRPVAIGRLHLAFRDGAIVATAEDLVVGNPAGFPAEAAPWLARMPRAIAQVEPMAWLRQGVLVVPRLELDRPRIEARGLADGRANYVFAGPPLPGEAAPKETGPRIGALVVREGSGRVVIARLGADFEVALATIDPPGEAPRLAGTAQGTYAGQPIDARFDGGALLALREAETAWPLRLAVANGPTELLLEGSLRHPLALRGADLRLTLAGPDMALLAPLTGVPFPQTAPFRLAGQLDYAEGRVRLMQAEGQVGRSDLSGGVMVTIGRERPVVAAELRSRRVDLRDLGGFIGATPGRVERGQSAGGRRGESRGEAGDGFVLPRAPLNLPKLEAADVHLDYVADSIEGRRMPFDSLVTQFDIQDGVVDVKRLVLPIGGGELAARLVLAPDDGALHARGEIELRRVDFSRLMQAAGVRGSGRLGGVGRIEGRGRSVAEILARGEGSVTLVMVGGTLSAFLVDLSGLRFAKALLSVLGLPEREPIECLVADFALGRGTLQARTLLLDTESAIVSGEGRITLPDERLGLRIRTSSKQPTIGALPTPVAITGTLADPAAAPEVGELAARAGAAAGLAALLPPLALLPTIQLGVGENSRCEQLQGRRGRR